MVIRSSRVLVVVVVSCGDVFTHRVPISESLCDLEDNLGVKIADPSLLVSLFEGSLEGREGGSERLTHTGR